MSVIQAHIRNFEDLALLIRYHGSELKEWEVPEVWVHLLSRLRETYCATNYIDSMLIYDTYWGDAAVSIQNGKKLAGRMDIHKVFVIDDDSEIAVLSKHLVRQRAIGIDIRYVRRRDVDCDPQLSDKLRRLPSIDFGIFDHDHVLVWELDGRKVKGGRVLFTSDQVNQHQEFFDALYKKAGAREGVLRSVGGRRQFDASYATCC